MEIRLQLPREFEATVRQDKSGEIVIEPHFATAKDQQVVAYLSVRGDVGNALHFEISVSGANGLVRSRQLRRVKSNFDTVVLDQTVLESTDSEEEPVAIAEKPS